MDNFAQYLSFRRAFAFHAGHWWTHNLVFLIDFLVLFASGFVVICLLCLHTHIMCINTTTWEMVSRDRITYLKELDHDVNPFHEGYTKNMMQFLCRLTRRKWDRVYNRNVAQDDNMNYTEAAIQLNKQAGGRPRRLSTGATSDQTDTSRYTSTTQAGTTKSSRRSSTDSISSR